MLRQALLMLERTVTTPDGRELRICEAGAADGLAVVVHNGTPMSRLLFRPHVEDADKRGVRLIGYDRPGYGGSTPQPGRTVADAAHDVEAIADALGIDHLATWGISGGGPHALACAALLPERVVAAASLAGVAPYPAEGLDWLAGMGEANVIEFGLALEGRDALEPFHRQELAGMLEAGPEGLTEAMRTLLSPVDEAVLTGETADYLFEATRVGSEARLDGWLDDDIAFTKPWGFELETIDVPVLLWQGREDRFVPFAHGEWLARHIPTVDARLSSDDGHVTLLARRVPQVHEWLIAASDRVRTASLRRT
jgi:pimeloyl-ACP methyl ester carboxylesterase